MSALIGWNDNTGFNDGVAESLNFVIGPLVYAI